MHSKTVNGHAVRFLRRSRKFVSALMGIAGLAIASLASTQAYADVLDPSSQQAPGNTGVWLPGSPNQVINIWCSGPSDPGCQGPPPLGPSYSMATTGDGTIFKADPNPTQPSTGTGVFQPFLREQRGSGACGVVDSTGKNSCQTVNGVPVGSEAAFNSDEKGQSLNFDAKMPKWTHSVLMSDIGTVTNNGIQYIVLQLDANQTSQAQTDTNKIVLSQMEIFIGPGLSDPEAGVGACGNPSIQNTGYNGNQFDTNPSQQKNDTLCGQKPVWSLDSGSGSNGTNGDVDVVLQASICDSNGQCGSGHGDLDVFIPVSDLGAAALIPTNNFVLYTEFLYANDGFEEWRFQAGTGCCSFPNAIPEPGTLALFGFGIAGLGWMQRRKKPILARG